MKQTYIALLRGINVGGHHKVPMEELKKIALDLQFEKPRTLLNSGNLVFEYQNVESDGLTSKLAISLAKKFGFEVPVILVSNEQLMALIEKNPFREVSMHDDIRLYVSFLKNEPIISLDLPYSSKDHSFHILHVKDKMVISYLDLSSSKTVKGMDELEKLFGKGITTRNWNTVVKLSTL